MSKGTVPSPRQLEFLDWEFGVFFHFGIRSFYPGHVDWDNKPMDGAAFNPAELDCGQWISVASEAGAKYAILVCKHHDGFANWPSKYTDYSVAHTPWREGRGDVVREFVDACRRYGLKVGLYYSPAQWGGAIRFEQGVQYDDYFISQITELLTGYGKIDYLWFDGCGSEGHEYDQARIIRAIQSMQPEILIFNMWDPDTRWVGNEEGLAPMPNFNAVSSVDFSVRTDGKEALAARRFLPAECDFRMRNTWFDDDNEDQVKSVEELMGIWELSVGRGANFLINIGPDRRGLLPEADAQRLKAFGAELRRVYGAPVGDFGPLQQIGPDVWAVESPEAVLVNRAVLTEDLSEGERICGFELYIAMPTGQEIVLYRGQTVGHKAICVFPTVRAGKFMVRTTGSDGACRLLDMKLHRS